MTLTKPVKIGIAVALVLIAIVAIYFILSGGKATSGIAATGTATTATGPAKWKIIYGGTQESTDAFCNSRPDSGLCEKIN